MSFAIRAAVLVSIQSKPDVWWALPAVISRVVRPAKEVQSVCDGLVAEGELQRRDLADGTPCYGLVTANLADPPDEPPVELRPASFSGYFRSV